MKHLNPRQGITTRSIRRRDNTPPPSCETPKSPPGDYNPSPANARTSLDTVSVCETPKSPPGDYNVVETGSVSLYRHRPGVKHLNPRQGITTFHRSFLPSRPAAGERVKHLNPRQGITTTRKSHRSHRNRSAPRVKHLNPRQGITTPPPRLWSTPGAARTCETPKSPPGDYNSIIRLAALERYVYESVKHLNPRQGITTLSFV